jgi:hypothetical protein
MDSTHLRWLEESLEKYSLKVPKGKNRLGKKTKTKRA